MTMSQKRAAKVKKRQKWVKHLKKAKVQGYQCGRQLQNLYDRIKHEKIRDPKDIEYERVLGTMTSWQMSQFTRSCSKEELSSKPLEKAKEFAKLKRQRYM